MEGNTQLIAFLKTAGFEVKSIQWHTNLCLDTLTLAHWVNASPHKTIQFWNSQLFVQTVYNENYSILLEMKRNEFNDLVVEMYIYLEVK